MTHLILHKVRGEPAFDVAEKLNDEMWIIPTSGWRCYPWMTWPLDDLADISDISMHGNHPRPTSFDHKLPTDWPDHYEPKGSPPPPKFNLMALISANLMTKIKRRL